MKYHAVFMLAVLFSSAGLVQAQDALTVAAITQKLDASPQDPAATTNITTATDVIKNSARTTLDDELKLLRTLSERADAAQTIPPIIVTLEAKYAADPSAAARLYIYEASLYEDYLKDPAKKSQALEKAASFATQAQIKQGLDQLDLDLQLGEFYLRQGDPKKINENQQRALGFYRKVLDFPIFEPPYFTPDLTYAEAFKDRYMKAALRTVENTEMRDIKNLNFYPFVNGVIAERFPQQSLLLDHNFPGVSDFKRHVALYLDYAAKEQKEGSPLRAHLEAVLQYVQRPTREVQKGSNSTTPSVTSTGGR